MNNLLISYQWGDPPESEEFLIKQIQTLGTATKIFNSTWLVATDLLPADAMIKLKSLISSRSEIIICESRHCSWFLSEPVHSELKKYHKQMTEF